jgi:hypothetical protein
LSGPLRALSRGKAGPERPPSHEFPVFCRRPNWSRGTYFSLGPALAEIRETVSQTKPDWLIFSDAQALLFCSWILPSANKALYLHGKPERPLGYLFGIAIRRKIKRVVGATPALRAAATIDGESSVEPSSTTTTSRFS